MQMIPLQNIYIYLECFAEIWSVPFSRPNPKPSRCRSRWAFGTSRDSRGLWCRHSEEPRAWRADWNDPGMYGRYGCWDRGRMCVMKAFDCSEMREIRPSTAHLKGSQMTYAAPFFAMNSVSLFKVSGPKEDTHTPLPVRNRSLRLSLPTGLFNKRRYSATTCSR